VTPVAGSGCIAAKACAVFLCAVFSAASFEAQTAKGPKISVRAVLTRGSEALKGLPNFGRNSLPSVYGEYRLERAASAVPIGPKIRVWMTAEALYLSSAAWTPSRTAGRPSYAARIADPADGGAYRFSLFDRPFTADGQGAEPKVWSVIIAFSENAGAEAAAEYERFVPIFFDRLAFFLSNARSRTDVSFPAVLEW
jgi:hypothetical protein